MDSSTVWESDTRPWSTIPRDLVLCMCWWVSCIGTLRYVHTLKKMRVLRWSVVICQYDENKSRNFSRGRVVILGVVVLYRRKHAHQHQEPVQLTKQVLRNLVLQHHTLYLNQYLRQSSVMAIPPCNFRHTSHFAHSLSALLRISTVLLISLTNTSWAMPSGLCVCSCSSWDRTAIVGVFRDKWGEEREGFRALRYMANVRDVTALPTLYNIFSMFRVVLSQKYQITKLL